MGASDVPTIPRSTQSGASSSATQPGTSRLLSTHGRAAVAATGPARPVSGGSHTPDLRHVRCSSTCTAIGHLPGSPDLHGTRGNVRWTGLGRPVAAAAAALQRDVRGGTRWSDMLSVSPPLETTALCSRWQLWRSFPSSEASRTPWCFVSLWSSWDPVTEILKMY